MRKTIMAMLAAAAVLVIGGAIGAAAQTGDEPEGDTTVTETDIRPVRGHLLEGVLDEMVADGVITDDQAAEIADWLENKRTELAAQRDELRAAFEAAWADDVLTADEVAEFPFADRLTAEDGPFAEAWADGQLTRDEFDAVKAELGGRHFGHHRAFGFLGSPDA
jgi:hypothetical protein